MCLPMRAHNIRNLDSSLGARQHVRGALTTLFNLKRVVQREAKGQSGLIKGFYPQQTSLCATCQVSAEPSKKQNRKSQKQSTVNNSPLHTPSPSSIQLQRAKIISFLFLQTIEVHGPLSSRISTPQHLFTLE
jgi:hypothetical protein